ncbi:preprotein translocase subunit SecY [Candidatus Parcubacteria bacterium]|uniref:Protein translocase subunit SecY n=1 Tax=Candidatus Kaiserbacteria bacterium CG10_big_fil_rev_8_21_14_0_10_47_16 TaxID=1974608 RepID=A0A2H0UDV5_9BACT|nr:preprotein translocase subunit SecY [Candidatus Parcubacteria bacterium]PIR84589.1 MAG: preprotein translocase subunit SecY [Candidatus Kaiserbacteria bacterium CG10_big_fil_rev_8_21_14_0_10_47_16]
MDTFIQKMKIIFTDSAIRNRILFVLGALIVFRALATIPIPGVDVVVLEQFFSNNEFLGLLNIFSGGGLSNLSIVLLGVGPFITASIIMQLLTVMSPKLKTLYTEEGESGRQKFTQITRTLTLPLAILQAFGFLSLLKSQGVLLDIGTFGFFANIVVVVAGSMLLLWLGELITEYGIGNGVSIIIFAGIIGGLPATFGQLFFTFNAAQIPLYIGFGAAALLIIYLVVVMTQAERQVPITYAKTVRGGSAYGGTTTYLPLRLNQAGVIPIIFALSILLFPQMILNVLSAFDIPGVGVLLAKVSAFYAHQIWYAVAYFAFVFLFTFFYTAVTFDPDAVSKNLQRQGSFIPGIRPGSHTSAYLGSVITRITFVGALFLGVVAILPVGMQALTGVTALAIGGTALLIAVSVVIDIVRRVDSQVSLREY